MKTNNWWVLWILKFLLKITLKLKTFAGILLIFVSAVAIGIANTESLYPAYTHFQHIPVGISFGDFKLEKSLLHWVNDGWMTLFFLLISLEIKREVLIGELSSIKKAILPIIAAIGGMVVPALIFIAFTSDSPSLLRGWAIPGGNGHCLCPWDIGYTWQTRSYAP